MADAATVAETATEFCIEGRLNLGALSQGYGLGNEWVPTRWCVVTEADSTRVAFTGTGKSNADLEGDWSVAYLPPDLVRIVNRDDPPDIEFHPTDNENEARAVRRLDPKRFLAELTANPDWREVSQGVDRYRLPGADHPVDVRIEDERLAAVELTADMAIHGTTAFTWRWTWRGENAVDVRFNMPGATLLEGEGRWRSLDAAAAEAAFARTPGAEPVEVPGEHWPARIDMRLQPLSGKTYLVRGVRTGFQHLVVDTGDGLVVGDAPAGWLEYHHIPPSELVPGLGTRGLSERLIDFLEQQFPGQAIAAVAVTHFHGDHAGGAAAFMDAGADVYAPPETTGWLRGQLAGARQAGARDEARGEWIAVNGPTPLAGGEVRLLRIGENPHSFEMLGLLAVDDGYFFVSDIHVPNSEDPVPRDGRARTECAFAGWAVAHLADDVIVVNSHSTPQTPVSRLAAYLESDACRPASVRDGPD